VAWNSGAVEQTSPVAPVDWAVKRGVLWAAGRAREHVCVRPIPKGCVGIPERWTHPGQTCAEAIAAELEGSVKG